MRLSCVRLAAPKTTRATDSAPTFNRCDVRSAISAIAGLLVVIYDERNICFVHAVIDHSQSPSSRHTVKISQTVELSRRMEIRQPKPMPD